MAARVVKTMANFILTVGARTMELICGIFVSSLVRVCRGMLCYLVPAGWIGAEYANDSKRMRNSSCIYTS